MYPLNAIRFSVTNKSEVVSHTASVQQIQLNAVNMTVGKRVYFADHRHVFDEIWWQAKLQWNFISAKKQTMSFLRETLKMEVFVPASVNEANRSSWQKIIGPIQVCKSWLHLHLRQIKMNMPPSSTWSAVVRKKNKWFGHCNTIAKTYLSKTNLLFQPTFMISKSHFYLCMQLKIKRMLKFNHQII